MKDYEELAKAQADDLYLCNPTAAEFVNAILAQLGRKATRGLVYAALAHPPLIRLIKLAERRLAFRIRKSYTMSTVMFPHFQFGSGINKSMKEDT